ncbi:MAG: host specificity factor TipJ family phage tail protein [Pseudomonadota bacterium]
MQDGEKTVSLTSCPEPFHVRSIQEQVPHGWTIAEMVLHAIPRVSIRQAHAFVNGDYIPQDKWLCVRPKPGTIVTIRVVPGKGGGGKNPIATVLSLALMVAAPALGASLATATGLATATSTGLISWTVGGFSGLSIATGIVSVVGRLAISAIAPPAKQRSSAAGSVASVTEKPTQFISGGKNQVSRFNAIPRPLGRHRMMPPYGALPFTEIVGNDQYVRMLFVWGYGPLEISDLRIGDTALSAFTGVEIETRQGYESDPPLTLFPDQINQNDLSITLSQGAGYQVRTTEDNVDEISVDVTFPRGLAVYNSNGSKSLRTVQVSVEYAPTGTSGWVNAGTTAPAISVTAKQSAAARQGLRFKVARGKYDVRLRRVTADATADTIIDECVWTALRSIRNAHPVKITGLAMTVLRIKATDQLNGVVDQFSGIVHSILPDWNGSAWVPQATSNPSSIYREVLQGKANARALNNNRLDLSALQQWHQDCAAAGRAFNYVVDRQLSVHDLMADVAASGRANPAVIDGKWRIVQDKPQSVPVQHFTPRNSFGFQSQKTFPDLPHAFRVRFINRDNNWQSDERIVYDDGYTAANATKFEGLELAGVTDTNQAWKDGRYHIATARLRPENYSFSTDIEHIVCTRGDLVRVTHDVLLVGLGSARIKSVADNGTNVTGITVDDTFFMETGKNYSVRIRKADGTSLIKNVTTLAGETKTLSFLTPFVLADAPGIGDLVLFGEAGQESIECIVKSIEPQSDLTARVTCVDAAPAVHTSDTGAIPAFDSHVTVPPDLKRPPAPIVASLQTGEEVLIINPDGSFSATITLSLEPPLYPTALSVSVLIRAVGETEFHPASFINAGNQVRILDVRDGEYYDLTLIHKNVYGMASLPTVISGVLVEGVTGIPDDVKNFSVTIQGQQANLSWDAVPNIDLSHYRIKWSPAVFGATWASSIDLIPKVAAPMTSKAVPALTGTYLIKAVDAGGRESANETLAISTIAEIEGFNAIAALTENPSFLGEKSGVALSGSTLHLAGADTVDDWTNVDDVLNFDIGNAGLVPEGTYTFFNSLDLGDVYTSRVSANVDVVGVDLFNNFDTVANVDLIENFDSTVDPSTFGVRLQLRTTNDDPGGTPVWSAWKDFVIGDYTTQAYQFRVILTSTAFGVTPEVSALEVQIDMPDRTESQRNLISNSAGATITFLNAFKETPAIGITGNDLASGDYFAVTLPTATGFNIRFFNSAGAGQVRHFDYLAKGYGKT